MKVRLIILHANLVVGAHRPGKTSVQLRVKGTCRVSHQERRCNVPAMRAARGTRAIEIICASALLGMVLILPACTATADPQPSVVPEVSTAAEVTASGDAIAATCAGVSVISTTVGNAQRDFASGAISDAQLSALINSAYAGYRSVLAFPPDQRGLRSEVEAVVAYIEANPPSASIPRFDPTAPEYYAALEPLTAGCLANGSEIAEFATTGG